MMFSWFSIGHCHIRNINTEVRFCCGQSGYPREVQGFSEDSSRGTPYILVKRGAPFNINLIKGHSGCIILKV